MRFLANENFPLDAVEAVRQIGHDVAWIRTDAPGSTDRAILIRAVKRTANSAYLRQGFWRSRDSIGLPASCGIVLFRLQAGSSAALAALVVAALQSRTDWAGQFSVVEPGRIRMRPLPAP